MKNIEKWYVRLIELAEGVRIAVVNGKPTTCGHRKCSGCDFKSFNTCRTEFIKWLNAEYEEPKEVDWSKVEKGTKVLVSDDLSQWRKGYFYDYHKDYTYPFHVISHQRQDEWSDLIEDYFPFIYCKLAEDEDE